MLHDAPASPPARPLVVHRSRIKVAGFLAVTLLGLAGTGALALGLVPGARPGSPAEFLMWLGAAGCALGSIALVRMLFDRRPVLEIGPEGLTDRRLSTGAIPWRDIAGLRLGQVRTQRFLALDLVPGARERLEQTPSQRLFTTLNGGFGGLTINAAGLDLEFDALVRAVHGAWAANRGR